MVLTKLNGTYELKSIKDSELAILIQGIELLKDNSANIVNQSEPAQKRIYISASQSANPSIPISKITESVNTNWDFFKKQMQDNHDNILKVLNRLQNQF